MRSSLLALLILATSLSAASASTCQQYYCQIPAVQTSVVPCYEQCVTKDWNGNCVLDLACVIAINRQRWVGK